MLVVWFWGVSPPAFCYVAPPRSGFCTPLFALLPPVCCQTLWLQFVGNVAGLNFLLDRNLVRFVNPPPPKTATLPPPAAFPLSVFTKVNSCCPLLFFAFPDPLPLLTPSPSLLDDLFFPHEFSPPNSFLLTRLFPAPVFQFPTLPGGGLVDLSPALLVFLRFFLSETCSWSASMPSFSSTFRSFSRIPVTVYTCRLVFCSSRPFCFCSFISRLVRLICGRVPGFFLFFWTSLSH